MNKILKSVPRELLMILKANDLLRHIGVMLKADSLTSSYPVIARYSRRTIKNYRLNQAGKN